MFSLLAQTVTLSPVASLLQNLQHIGIHFFLLHLHSKATTRSLAVSHQLTHLKTPKYTKIHIILSNWENYTGEVVHGLPFSTINAAQTMPLNLKIH